MNIGRWLVRIALVLLLGGVSWIAYSAWSRTQPSHLLSRAKSAIKAEKYDSAEIHLKNLLKQSGKHVEGNRLMAEVLVAMANQENEGVILAGHPGALHHMQIAAGAAPEDIGLQKELLAAYLMRGDVNSSLEFAKRVHAADAKSEDALYALSNDAARRNAPEAEELLDKYLGLSKITRAMRLLDMRFKYFSKNKKTEKAQEALDIVCETATFPAAELELMAPIDCQMLPAMVLRSVELSNDLPTAVRRSEAAIMAAEQLSTHDAFSQKELVSTATKAIELVRDRVKSDTTDGEKQKLSDLALRAEAARQSLFETGEGAPFLRIYSATEFFRAGQIDKAIASATASIKAISQLPKDEQNGIAALHEIVARSMIQKGLWNEIKPHVASMTEHESTRGLGHLFAGAMAYSEGRYEKALHHHQMARRSLGDVPLVQLSLASTYRALRRWNLALPILDNVKMAAEQTDPTAKAITGRLKINTEAVHFAIMQGRMAMNDWKKAEPSFNALKGTDWENRAVSLASLFHFTRGKRDEGREMLNSARARAPRDLNLVRAELMMLQLERKQDDAEKLLIKVAAENEGNVASQLMLANFHLARGKTKEAKAQIEKTIQAFPMESAPLFLKARLQIVEGDAKAALQLAEQLANKPETKQMAGLLTAMALVKENKLPEAAKAIEAMAAEQPKAAGLNVLQAELAIQQGNYEDALTTLDDVLDVSNLQRRTRSDLVRAILMLANKEGAKKAADRVSLLLKEHPEDEFLWLVQADLQFKQGQLQAGLSSLGEADRLAPESATVPFIRAQIFTTLRRYADAEKSLQVALSRHSEHVRSLALRPAVLLAMGKNNEALTAAQTALKVNPRLWGVYLSMSTALRRMDRKEESAKLLAKLLDQQPRYTRAILGLVGHYVAEQDYPSAIAICQKYREDNLQDVTLASVEIQLHCRNKDLETAQKVATAFDTLEKKSVSAELVARAFGVVGEDELAITWVSKVLERAKAERDERRQAIANALKGEFAYKLALEKGDDKLLEEARDAFQMAVAANEKDYRSANNLAWVLAVEFDQAAEAAKVLANAFDNESPLRLSLTYLDTCAEVYRRAGNLDKAEKMLNEVLAKNPGIPLLVYHRGLIYAKQGKAAEAKTDLMAAKESGKLNDSQNLELNKVLATLK